MGPRRLGRRDVLAELLAEVRAKGLELRVDGSRLKVSGDPRAYSRALRSRLLALKREIVEHLRNEQERGAASYARDERAWASRYLTHVALARGYDETLARVAAAIVAKAPPRAPFHVERDQIVIGMGEGLEVRVHRVHQVWATA